MAFRWSAHCLYGSGLFGVAVLTGAVSGGAGVVFCDKESPSYLDPEAWERAAKAVRDINSQQNAKKVFEQLKLEELTRAQEAKVKEAEYRAQAAAVVKEQERARWEEQRQNQREQVSQHAEMKRYEDDLAWQRMKAEHDLQRQRNRELVRLQEDSARSKEQERLKVEQQIQAERRAAEQYKAELEKQIQREHALAEAEGRIRQQRENEDVYRREMIVQYQERTKLVIQAISETFAHVGRGAFAVVTDADLLFRTAGLSTLLLLGFFGTRESARVVGRTVERWLGTPRLIRDTSRTHIWNWQTWFRTSAKSADEVRKDFTDIILPTQLHDHVRALAAVTSNTKRHGAPFRHMLFYGPPGTGKTMVAKRLAYTSGLDYAIMSGGDVAPLAGAAVTQLHAVFDWAERSRKGLLLFIDEADAFLGRRSDAMSEGLRGALNALLFRTGDQSKDFLVVLATNRPGDLDPAVLDRIDEVLEFPLPGPEERKSIVNVYLQKYILRAGQEDGTWSTQLRRRLLSLWGGRKAVTDRIRIRESIDALLWDAASSTTGFSGRELAKLMASVQAAVYGTRHATLTADMFNTILKFKVKEHQRRAEFRDNKEEYLR